jgi:hypothetical protein
MRPICFDQWAAVLTKLCEELCLALLLVWLKQQFAKKAARQA